jgi:hypothetical protein
MRLLALILLLIPLSGVAQKERPHNLEGKFEGQKRRFHFGFLLGYNSANYQPHAKPEFFQYDSLVSITPSSSPGFILAPLAVLHISKNWKLRVVPIQLSFEDRVLTYRYLESDTSFASLQNQVQSTYLQFPVSLKFRTDRLNNFAAYMIGGIQYGIDLQSNEKAVNSNNPDDVIKANRNAWDLQIGGGADFFLKYFKFGIEIRYSQGMNNMLIQDNSYYAAPLDRLRNRSWVVALTFEG